MQISEHYPAFPQKTLLVLTNNELARLYILHDREITDCDVIETPEPKPLDRLSTPSDLDAAKQHRRDMLYGKLSKELLALIATHEIEDVLLCAPEANKNDLIAMLHPDINRRVTSVIAKNLASMELPQVVRILFES